MNRKNTQTVLTAALLMLVNVAIAQIQHGGQPYQWDVKKMDITTIPFVSTDLVDLAAVAAEDEVTDQYKETPYRFGVDYPVTYDVFADGILTEFADGDKMWQLGIYCPEATSINFIFGEYELPEGATVYIWSADRDEYIGALTNQNNKGFDKLAVGLIHNERIVIEYHQPANVVSQARLRLENITHGYRPVVNKWKEDKGPFGTSGSCNMNVNCPDGDNWQDEKRGVALIISNGNAHCTGSLINNTNQDGTPYFLTAAHCDANESNWIFYFNHEYSGCSNSGSAPTNQSISGATELASTNPSDAHLIELSSDVPESYEPYFNGWDKSGDPVQWGVGIHHPAGDVKKISFDDDPLTITQYFNNTPGDYDHWRIEQWERQTTTEGGSSGSPLFDQDHRIIGQLHGGIASCGNSIDDYYGAFHVSFPYFSSWLDPNNSGVTTLDGYGPYDIVYSNDAQAFGINNLPNFDCAAFAFDPVFELRNNGTALLTSATINYSYNGTAQTPITWTGSLSLGQIAEISLVTFVPTSGNNTIEIDAVTTIDENQSNNDYTLTFSGDSEATSGADEVNIYILPDNYGGEITWTLTNPMGTVVASGGPYSNSNTDPINETYVVPYADQGCYEFTIMDDASDGICCGYGIGNYEITDANGTVLASGGEYGDSESSLLAMSAPVSIEEISLANQVVIYPNPATEVVYVEVGQSVGVYQLNVINVVGQIIIAKDNRQGRAQVTLDQLTPGVYFIEVNTTEGKLTKKIMVK